MKSLYRGKNNNLLSALTLNDAVYWGADLFFATVFAFFVLNNIEGGSATHVGIVYGCYRIVRAFCALPVGKFLDQHRGYIDEMWALILSSIIVGGMYITLFYASELWHIYVAMLLIAVGHALNIGSWAVLFYDNITKKYSGETIGMYNTIMQIVYGLAAALSGILGETFGFEWIVLFAGILTILSGFTPLFIRSDIKAISRHGNH